MSPPFHELTLDVLENAPEYIPTPSPGFSICELSTTLCQAGAYDPFLLAVAFWATLQLTWTSILAVSQLWQVSRQMTTLEVSNLGRYGYMGGRGGSSLRDQTGAMRQAMAVGAGVGPTGAGEEAAADMGDAGPEGNLVAAHVHGPNCDHSGRPTPGKICNVALKKLSAPCMQVLGLDRFTKGKALGGMKKAGRGQNPFDLGVAKVN